MSKLNVRQKSKEKGHISKFTETSAAAKKRKADKKKGSK